VLDTQADCAVDGSVKGDLGLVMLIGIMFILKNLHMVL